jgi:dolichol-phosphate mannosyltransferase
MFSGDRGRQDGAADGSRFPYSNSELAMKLSIIIPTYNEAMTLGIILEKVLDVPLEKEVIIVDDGSTDSTGQILEAYRDRADVLIITHSRNLGKGASIRSALTHVSGEAVVIQDADLELNPLDFLKLIEPLQAGTGRVIYGARQIRPEGALCIRFHVARKILSALTNLLYRQKLTDEPTCYKMFDSKLLQGISLNCIGFEFCAEVTAKVARQGIQIKEIPINYYPRTMKAGKKIRWTDGIIAVWTLIKYRFCD